jgi:prepilin-type processing-associated H-X9-DG protein
VDVDHGEVVGRGLDDVSIVMRLDELGPVDGRATGGSERGRFEGLAEVRENLPDGGRVGDEGDEADVTAARGALERNVLADAGEELGPCNSGGVVGAGLVVPCTLTPALSRRERQRRGPPPDGVVFRRSRIRLREVPDGLSATYMLGEKYVEPGSIATGLSDDDDQCLYSGHDRDVLRTGLEPPSLDRAGFDPVTVSGAPGSTNKFPLPLAFGSGHPGGCGMAMADGSVRIVAYEIDAAAHRAAASRNDGPKR